MFHFKFHVSLFKTLRERFHAPTVFLNRSHRGFELLPQCFCFSPSVFFEWNIETKNETEKSYVSAFKSIDNQQDETKNETWKQKTPLVKYT